MKYKKIILLLLVLFPIILLSASGDDFIVKDSTFKKKAALSGGGKIHTQFTDCVFDKLHLSFVESDTLKFERCHFHDWSTLNIIRANWVVFDNCTFSEECAFYFMDMGPGGDSSKQIGNIKRLSFITSSPRIISFVSQYTLDTLDFSGIDFLKEDCRVIGLNPTGSTGLPKIWLGVESAEKIIFDFCKYDMVSSLRYIRRTKVIATYTDKFRLYSKILKVQQDNFYGQGIIKADTALHELQWKQFHRVEDGISKFMLNYSYNKGGLLVAMAFAFLFFFIINFFTLRHFAGNVYVIDSIKEQLQKTHAPFSTSPIIQRLGLSLLYTAIIFFGFHLDINHFQFNRKMGVSYILLIFVIGVFFTLSMAAVLIVGK